MQIRLPEDYKMAREIILKSLRKDYFVKSCYNTIKTNPCRLKHFNISEKKDKIVKGYMVLELEYTEQIINKYGKFEEKKVVQVLNILTPAGDKLWPYNMVVKLWKGKYPSTVALDIDRGIVYFLNITQEHLELEEFGALTDSENNAILDELDDTQPYKIKLDEAAMFDYISEEEGLNHLRNNVYVEFDCGVRFTVYNELNREIELG